MIHPLFRLIATRPHMVAEHLEAYSDLVAEEADAFTTSLKMKAVLAAVAVASGGVALVLIGVAAMLAAAIPVSSMPAAWALIVVPAVPLLLCVGCGLVIRQPSSARGFKAVREQFAADVAMLREAGGNA